MSSLIIGGLFVIAVLIVIGLVFLIRSTPATAKTPADTTKTVQGVQEVDEAVQTNQVTQASQVSQASQAAQGGLPVQPALSTPDEETVPLEEDVVASTEPVQAKVQRFPIASGQFHSLSVELRALHTQAQEIEQRINHLNDVIERVEYDQNHYMNLDSQEHSHEIESASKN